MVKKFTTKINSVYFAILEKHKRYQDYYVNSRKIRWVGGLNLFKKGYICILRSGSVFWHFVKLWVIEWEELIIKDMAMHTIVLLLEAAGNVNRKAKVFHAMHNWILNGLLMTLAGASQQHCCVFYTHKYISIWLESCMYYSQVNCRLEWII